MSADAFEPDVIEFEDYPESNQNPICGLHTLTSGAFESTDAPVWVCPKCAHYAGAVRNREHDDRYELMPHGNRHAADVAVIRGRYVPDISGGGTRSDHSYDTALLSIPAEAEDLMCEFHAGHGQNVRNMGDGQWTVPWADRHRVADHFEDTPYSVLNLYAIIVDEEKRYQLPSNTDDK